jgi:hypothetical protein
MRRTIPLVAVVAVVAVAEVPAEPVVEVGVEVEESEPGGMKDNTPVPAEPQVEFPHLLPDRRRCMPR